MKTEVLDEGYDSAGWSSCKRGRKDIDETQMVAKRIKQELGIDDDVIEQHQSFTEKTRDVPAPLVFDHFICLRIGLNSQNNVQNLMALLTAHNFVDLTVIPSTPLVTTPVQPSPTVSHVSEPSTSRVREEREYRPPTKKYAPRRQPGDNLPGIPNMLKCRKCNEIMSTGSTCNSVLAHVQKYHLKMAAFQCRICKHYRTTQERIQSHVTTVHKARSTTFDDSLAGPISDQDMQSMEKMITHCFPEVFVKLEITDRLSVKSFHYGKSK